MCMIHAHAMPLPVLDWLASRGLADLADVDSRFVRLDVVIGVAVAP